MSVAHEIHMSNPSPQGGVTGERPQAGTASEGISVFVIETPERPLPVHHGGRRGKRVADEAGRDASPGTRAAGLQNRGDECLLCVTQWVASCDSGPHELGWPSTITSIHLVKKKKGI